jgi:hypothetical protein
MGNLAKTELGRRAILALEQIANDPNQKPAKRRSAARKLAEWKAARNA